MSVQIPEHRKSFWRFEDVHKGKGNGYARYYHHNIGEVLPLHSHDFYEINMILSGCGKHYIRQRELLTAKGDIFVIPPNVKHGYTCNENMTVYHILLSDRFCAEFGPLLDRLPGYRFLFHIEPILRSSILTPFYLKGDCMPQEEVTRFIGLLEEGEAAGNEAETACHMLSLIAEMAGRMHRLHAFNDKNLPDRTVLSLVESIAYIDAQCTQKLDFRAMAQKCAMAYSTYWRLFKKLTGMTPTEYQLSGRIKMAELLLRNSDESVLSVALSCGFYDSSHFIREFIKWNKMTPAEYRKSLV